MRRHTILAAVALAALAGCQSAGDLIAEGDRLRDAKQYDQALERYAEALGQSGLTSADKERAYRSRGEAELAKGDLVRAEASIKQLPDSASVKATLLGHVAYARRDTPAAEALYREAFRRGERGLVTTRLAEIVGGEADAPRGLAEAAKVLREGGGEESVAQALDEAREVWTALDRGEPPAGLVARLDRARAAAPGYVSIEMLRADAFDRSGDRDKAKAIYATLASFTPKPSDAFMARVAKRQKEKVLSSGDVDKMQSLVDSGIVSAEDAAQIRSTLARSREELGDPLGALDLYRDAAKGSGVAATRALCEVGRLEAARGRPDAAREAFQKADERTEADVSTRALLAIAKARSGDPLGARVALEKLAKDPALEPSLRDDAAFALRSCERFRLAVGALVRSEPGRARRLARSVLASAPSWRVAAAIETAGTALDAADGSPVERARAASAALEASGATGETRDAFADARLGALLEAGAWDDVAPLAAKDPSAAAALVRRGPSVVARLVALGRVEDAAHLFEKLKEHRALDAIPDLVGRVRGDASFAALWTSRRFAEAAGGPDPLLRRAPYACDATLAGGVRLGVVRVRAASEQGLSVVVPGRDEPVLVPRERLAPLSLRGVDDEVFERADRAARAQRRPAPTAATNDEER